jgi:sigma-B regulation protein RsbU (phosphoserine phosphatase)
METQALECGAVWGGTRTLDMDVRSEGLTASIYSKAHDGLDGGDVYYFSVCSSGLLTRIALGDVQGHGEAVSHLSGWLYDALYRRMNTLAGQKVLSDLNPRVHGMGFKAITTMVVAGYYAKEAKLYFAYAGHPPMLVWRQSDPVWRPLEIESTGAVSDLPLGVFPKMSYQQGSVPLAPGDRIVLCTDGVLECENAEGEELGVAGLAVILNQTTADDLAVLKTNLLQKLDERSNHAPLGDDVTFLFAQMSGGKELPRGFLSRMLLPSSRSQRHEEG